MINQHEYEVVVAMQAFGSPFIRALAECFMRADYLDFKELKAAFPEYWKRYEKIAEERSANRNK